MLLCLPLSIAAVSRLTYACASAMSLAGWVGSSWNRSMYSWLASGPSSLGAFVGSSHLLWLAQPVAYVRYFALPVIRKTSISPLINSALNQVESPKPGLPAIQWFAASSIGARSGQAAAGCAGAPVPAAAVVGISPAVIATTAANSLYFCTGASLGRPICKRLHIGLPKKNMSVNIHDARGD